MPSALHHIWSFYFMKIFRNQEKFEIYTLYAIIRLVDICFCQLNLGDKYSKFNFKLTAFRLWYVVMHNDCIHFLKYAVVNALWYPLKPYMKIAWIDFYKYSCWINFGIRLRKNNWVQNICMLNKSHIEIVCDRIIDTYLLLVLFGRKCFKSLFFHICRRK